MTDNIKFIVTIDDNKCDECYDCIDICSEQALFHDIINDKIKWNKADCTRCEQCDDICEALHCILEIH